MCCCWFLFLLLLLEEDDDESCSRSWFAAAKSSRVRMADFKTRISAVYFVSCSRVSRMLAGEEADALMGTTPGKGLRVCWVRVEEVFVVEVGFWKCLLVATNLSAGRLGRMRSFLAAMVMDVGGLLKLEGCLTF